MTSDSGWRRIAMVPNEKYGDSNLGSMLRICLALGYHPSEVELCTCIDEDGQTTIALEVPQELFPEDLYDLRAQLEPASWLDSWKQERAVRRSQVEPVPAPEPVVETADTAEPIAAPAEEATSAPTAAEVVDFRCASCGKTFTSEHGLKTHLTKTHPIDDGPLSYCGKHDPMLACSECGFYTTAVITLAVHTRKAHNRDPLHRERVPLIDEERNERFDAAKSLSEGKP